MREWRSSHYLDKFQDKYWWNHHFDPKIQDKTQTRRYFSLQRALENPSQSIYSRFVYEEMRGLFIASWKH